MTVHIHPDDAALVYKLQKEKELTISEAFRRTFKLKKVQQGRRPLASKTEPKGGGTNGQ